MAGNLIGLNCPWPPLRQVAERAIESASWDVVSMRDGVMNHRGDRVVIIESNYQAETVRAEGGTVVHLETRARPSYPDHKAPGGIQIEVGDWVIDKYRGNAAAVIALITALGKTEAA